MRAHRTILCGLGALAGGWLTQALLCQLGQVCLSSLVTHPASGIDGWSAPFAYAGGLWMGYTAIRLITIHPTTNGCPSSRERIGRRLGEGIGLLATASLLVGLSWLRLRLPEWGDLQPDGDLLPDVLEWWGLLLLPWLILMATTWRHDRPSGPSIDALTPPGTR